MATSNAKCLFPWAAKLREVVPGMEETRGGQQQPQPGGEASRSCWVRA